MITQPVCQSKCKRGVRGQSKIYRRVKEELLVAVTSPLSSGLKWPPAYQDIGQRLGSHGFFVVCLCLCLCICYSSLYVRPRHWTEGWEVWQNGFFVIVFVFFVSFYLSLSLYLYLLFLCIFLCLCLLWLPACQTWKVRQHGLFVIVFVIVFDCFFVSVFVFAFMVTCVSDQDIGHRVGR